MSIAPDYWIDTILLADIFHRVEEKGESILEVIKNMDLETVERLASKSPTLQEWLAKPE